MRDELIFCSQMQDGRKFKGWMPGYKGLMGGGKLVVFMVEHGTK